MVALKKYTTEELNTIIEDAWCCYATLATKVTNQELGGIDCEKALDNMKYLYLALNALSRWQQYSDGDSSTYDNCLTEEQFSATISKIKSICGCECAGSTVTSTADEETLYILEFTTEDGTYISSIEG